MFEWITRRRLVAPSVDKFLADVSRAPARTMIGQYALLYEYLEHRYANTVVLTFAQIEDLVGFQLPDQARSRREWWTDPRAPDAGSSYADAWRLASRTAVPNLIAQIVTFDRVLAPT
jgi:hypothetical protein